MEELETEMIRGGRALHPDLSILDLFPPLSSSSNYKSNTCLVKKPWKAHMKERKLSVLVWPLVMVT